MQKRHQSWHLLPVALQPIRAPKIKRLPLASDLFNLQVFDAEKVSTQLLCGLAVAEAAAQSRSFFNIQHLPHTPYTMAKFTLEELRSEYNSLLQTCEIARQREAQDICDTIQIRRYKDRKPLISVVHGRRNP
jgi:hypothetical protein